MLYNPLPYPRRRSPNMRQHARFVFASGSSVTYVNHLRLGLFLTMLVHVRESVRGFIRKVKLTILHLSNPTSLHVCGP